MEVIIAMLLRLLLLLFGLDNRIQKRPFQCLCDGLQRKTEKKDELVKETPTERDATVFVTAILLF